MKLTSSLVLSVFTALALSVVPGCDDKKADAGADAKKTDTAAADAKKADAPADAKPEDATNKAEAPGDEAPAEEAAAGGAGADKIGIAVCDEYVEKYTKCIDEHAPEATKAPLKEGVAKKVEQWKKELAGPGKDSLEQACDAALNAVKKTSTNWGCTY